MKGGAPAADQVGLKYRPRLKRAEIFGRVVVTEKSIAMMFIFSFLEIPIFEWLFP
jgi:hypothetical protein